MRQPNRHAAALRFLVPVLLLSLAACGFRPRPLVPDSGSDDDAILLAQLTTTRAIDVTLAREGDQRGLVIHLRADERFVLARRVRPGRYWIARVQSGPRAADRRYTNVFVVEPGRVNSLGTIHFEVGRAEHVGQVQRFDMFQRRGSEFVALLDEASRNELARFEMSDVDVQVLPRLGRRERPMDRATLTNNPTRLVAEMSQGLETSSAYGSGVGGEFVTFDFIALVGPHHDPTTRLRLDPLLGVGSNLSFLAGAPMAPAVMIGGFNFQLGGQLRFGPRGGYTTLAWTPGFRNTSYNMTGTVGPFEPSVGVWSALGMRATVGFHVRRWRLGTGVRVFRGSVDAPTFGTLVTWDVFTVGYGG